VTTIDNIPSNTPDADLSVTGGSSNSRDTDVGGDAGEPDESGAPGDGGTDSDHTGTATVAPTSTEDSRAPIECPNGTTECAGECLPGNSCCATTCEAPNATTECRDGQCVIVECFTEFVDCDGLSENGCEQDMAAEDAPVASVAEPFPVPPLDFPMGVDEMDFRAWVGVPRFRLASGCGTCESNGPPPDVPPVTPSVNRGKVPGSSDLRANYALAWDETGLWVNLVVVDNELLDGARVNVGDGDSRLYDNLMVVWDPTAGASNPGTGDDHITFIGIDQNVVDWRDEDTSDIAVSVKGAGQCRSIHAHFNRTYLFGSDGSMPDTTFKPGDVHGLVVAYNDFDFEPGTTVSEREHFVFGVGMTFTGGSDYFQNERTLPQIELIDP
jgi:hypothetical protein